MSNERTMEIREFAKLANLTPWQDSPTNERWVNGQNWCYPPATNKFLSMGSRLAPRLMSAQGEEDRRRKVIIDEASHQALQELADRRR